MPPPHSFTCTRIFVFVYLLLVFPLQVQSGLDVSSCLLEGLSLRHLSRVVGADPDHVGAHEDHHIGTDLITHTEHDRGHEMHAHVTSQENSELCSTWVRSISKVDNSLSEDLLQGRKNASNV